MSSPGWAVDFNFLGVVRWHWLTPRCLCPQDEILADGSRVIHKSSRQAPGRVSVIASDGELVLDEYIEVTEPIVDYLTRFSGLASGDLSAQTSPYRLCSLKVRQCACACVCPSVSLGVSRCL